MQFNFLLVTLLTRFSHEEPRNEPSSHFSDLTARISRAEMRPAQTEEDFTLST